MSERPGLAEILIAQVMTRSEPPPTWHFAGAVLLVVLVWGALEYGLYRLLSRTNRAIKSIWSDPQDRP